MTFNLRIHVDSDGENAWPNRVDAAAQAINQSEAAIIGTQELSLSMIRDLEEKLTEYKWIGEGREGGLKGEFSAIFYRNDIFQVIENGTFWLSETPEIPASQSWNTACTRICTWTKLKHVQGREIYFFNTHLDHISTEARLNGIKLITEKMMLTAKQNKLPVILTGDFNTEPYSEVIKYLSSLNCQDLILKNIYNEFVSGIKQEVGLTFHDFKGGTQGEPIDYIFVSPNIKIKDVIINRSMIDGRYPSDHYPVSAILEI